MSEAANDPELVYAKLTVTDEEIRVEPVKPLAASAGSAPEDWPIEARISHRILIYAAQRKPHAMNQFTIEDIIREEMNRGKNE